MESRGAAGAEMASHDNYGKSLLSELLGSRWRQYDPRGCRLNFLLRAAMIKQLRGKEKSA